MIATIDIKINKTTKSRINEQDLNDVPFGKCISDHMFAADYVDGEWKNAAIMPYQDMPLSFAMSALHYGQAIFEGMKAYKYDNGEIGLFRPLANFKRLNISAERMTMPEVPEELFMSGLLELMKIDQDWIPSTEKGSLYIRPLLIATDNALGVRPSEKYKFVILTCPVGKYFSEPLKVLVEQNYIRAVEGGVGFVKTAGNYGRSMFPSKLAQKRGYQQVIWTDAKTHQYVEESGTMNLMFVINDTLITPQLGDTILAGITRHSVLTLARSWGMKVEERKVSIKEIIAAIECGTLHEAFGTGTASSIAQIVGLGYKKIDYILPPVEQRKFSNKVDKALRNICKGREEDLFNWMLKVK